MVNVVENCFGEFGLMALEVTMAAQASRTIDGDSADLRSAAKR